MVRSSDRTADRALLRDGKARRRGRTEEDLGTAGEPEGAGQQQRERG